MMSPAPTSPGNKRRFLILGLIVVFALGAVGAVLTATVVIPRIISGFGTVLTGNIPLPSPHAKSSGPSRPLNEIWDVAQKEATKLNKDAVLDSVQVTSVGDVAGVAYSGPLTGSLDFTFYYVGPDDSDITVDVEDADPASTVQSTVMSNTSQPQGLSRYQRAQQALPGYEQLLRSYKITPRDAISATWDDATKYALENSLQPEHVLPLVSTSGSASGDPAWDIAYWYNPGRSSISLGDIFNLPPEVASYTVDGVAGKVLTSEHETIQLTVTPHQVPVK